ncbi:hypothetical protein [Desulfobacter vibrioformis]|uniref:hypothetical protein n=1 Tax=Desulfobacter vibrioformis TaxID=34031 RepID=UPI000554CAE8|nr:hypothetical protein [Desulfobacter vibrioformis]
MAEAYPLDTRLDARCLYVVDGMTYDQVSTATGVSVSQLKKWGSDEGWTARRREYRDAQVSIRENTVLLRAGLLKNALTTKDAQDVYAVAAMEKIAIALEKIKPGAADPARDVPDVNFNDPASMVDALWGAIEHRAARMINSPDTMDLKQIQAGLKAWGDMKRQYATKEDTGSKQKGFDADQAELIRKLLEG